MIPTLRTLTKKSKLGFGKYKELTVQKIIDMRMPLVLISPYFKLTSINYTEDILKELRISSKYKVDKPGKDLELYYEFLDDKGFKRFDRGKGADKLKPMTKPMSKGKLRNINQGK